MDLLKLLRAEHSKKNTDRIVGYISDDKDRFAQLMQLFFKGEYRITQRAAWPLSYCVRRHPELITPYFKPLLDNLDRTDIQRRGTDHQVHGHVQRWPHVYHGQRFDDDLHVPRSDQRDHLHVHGDGLQLARDRTGIRSGIRHPLDGARCPGRSDRHLVRQRQLDRVLDGTGQRRGRHHRLHGDLVTGRLHLRELDHKLHDDGTRQRDALHV